VEALDVMLLFREVHLAAWVVLVGFLTSSRSLSNVLEYSIVDAIEVDAII
jgi:hypothetical protein